MVRVRTTPPPPAQGCDDAQLLARTRETPEAFGVFYDRYERALAGYFMRRTGDPEVAGDLTAEVFAAALRAAHRYRAQGPTAAGWLFTIAHNVLAKSRRRGRVEAAARKRLGIREAPRLAPDEVAAVERAGSDERWALELLERLPAEQREAIRARVLDERSYGDIAGELETSELVVRKRVSRGLSRLRAELERP
ncbi:MAG TPA: RNA polymerase sigma factor [Solirubrobacteraceae bacterium]|jgi:RNA polymerase sigma-70 factor (ECF subfamily)|nr:RNA polymerase sigma factor [Solirubrobacteraceae bacterium]